jgi:AcrR family transcriptional regulator
MNLASNSRRRPQRLKDRLRAVASEAILEAAEAVLSERGLDAPMEVIATRAGVAVGTLYNHFKDRKALVGALIEAHRDRVLADVKEAEEATQGQPVRAQLVAMLEAMHAGWGRYFLMLKQSEQVPDAKRRREIRERMGRLFGGVLERARQAGQLPADPEGLQPVVLHGLVRALFALAADEPQRLPPERVAAYVADLFLSGAAKAGAP